MQTCFIYQELFTTYYRLHVRILVPGKLCQVCLWCCDLQILSKSKNMKKIPETNALAYSFAVCVTMKFYVILTPAANIIKLFKHNLRH
jgi:hypothetical protein